MRCPFNIALTVRSLGLLCGFRSTHSSLTRAGKAGRKDTGTGQTGFVAAGISSSSSEWFLLTLVLCGGSSTCCTGGERSAGIIVNVETPGNESGSSAVLGEPIAGNEGISLSCRTSSFSWSNTGPCEFRLSRVRVLWLSTTWCVSGGAWESIGVGHGTKSTEPVIWLWHKLSVLGSCWMGSEDNCTDVGDT